MFRAMDRKTVEHVAHLARLRLSESESEALASELTRITDYIDQLREVDVEGVDPVVHPVSDRNAFRDDEIREGLSRKQVAENAPDEEQGFFRVPKVIE